MMAVRIRIGWGAKQNRVFKSGVGVRINGEDMGNLELVPSDRPWIERVGFVPELLKWGPLETKYGSLTAESDFNSRALLTGSPVDYWRFYVDGAYIGSHGR